jgi:hypothetical protein
MKWQRLISKHATKGILVLGIVVFAFVALKVTEGLTKNYPKPDYSNGNLDVPPPVPLDPRYEHYVSEGPSFDEMERPSLDEAKRKRQIQLQTV